MKRHHIFFACSFRRLFACVGFAKIKDSDEKLNKIQ